MTRFSKHKALPLEAHSNSNQFTREIELIGGKPALRPPICLYIRFRGLEVEENIKILQLNESKSVSPNCRESGDHRSSLRSSSSSPNPRPFINEVDNASQVLAIHN